MKEHPEFLQKIDWKLLREQKATLHHLMNTKLGSDINVNLYGIMHLIDALQDFAVDVMGLSDKEVFNLLEDENNS
jgi:hypothetical protein